ncbi:MAG: PEP-CTERM sorting domain-containing protein [Verrucomicrobiales bacterium]|jgi:hypothetical protein|nr:PEP-CTERM sorting domain-containing protein [Verrucomicrobiales bacterium]
MKISILKTLTLTLLGALSASALNTFAASLTVSGSTLEESDKSYDDSNGEVPALSVTSAGHYSGTNITLNTYRNGGYMAEGGYGARVNGWGNVSTLSLTDSTIHTAGASAPGIYLPGGLGVLNNVNITTEGDGSYGIRVQQVSDFTTLTSGTIRTAGAYASGINLETGGVALNGVDIETTGDDSHGVEMYWSATLTLTDSAISATGNSTYGLRLVGNNNQVDLNHSTLTGSAGSIYIPEGNVAVMTITGSNGSVITGDVVATNYNNTRVDITLTGADTALHGDFIQNSIPIVLTLTLGADALFHGGGELDILTVESGAILGYTDGLFVTGEITIGDNITIDLSSLTETDNYLVLDWTGASGGDAISGDQFIIAGAGVEGTFSVANNQLYFNATAVPEPSTWFLFGAALGVLALIRRQTK